jgi:hypothetical protein
MNCIYKINKNINNLISGFEKCKNLQKFFHKTINKKNQSEIAFAYNFNNELYKSIVKHYKGYINIILKVFFLKCVK